MISSDKFENLVDNSFNLLEKLIESNELQELDFPPSYTLEEEKV